MARNYKKIDIYHLSYTFVLDLYKLTNDFPKSELNNVTSQIRRAAVSIPLNIVEGSAKASNKEFIHYLNTAYGSAKEVEVLLQLSRDFNYLNDDGFTFLANRLDELNAKLFLFLRNMEGRIPNRKQRFFREFKERAIS
jgi:four helix bundle protein